MAVSMLGALAVFALLHVPSTNAGGSCPTLFNFYADRYDCTKFYRCFWGSPVEFVCPAGTHWNQQLLTCDHAYKVPCVTGIMNPIYKLVRNDGYGYVKDNYVSKGYVQEYPSYVSKGYVKDNYVSKGYVKEYPSYVTKGYVKDDYVSKGYEKGSYAGYDSTGNSYGGAYVKANDYGNYGGYYGRSYAPNVGLSYGRYGNRHGNYKNGGYVRAGYARYPANYGGYIAGGYARNAAGYDYASVTRSESKGW